MKRRSWRGLGISERLLAIAVLPAALMFLAVSIALYATTRNDIRRDVSERGRLMATALAQSTQYGLVSGNLDYVQVTMRQLVESDPSIVCLQLLNARGESVAAHCQARQEPEQTSLSAPVNIEALGGSDLLDPVAPPASGSLKTIGHVRVTMSATPLFEARRGPLLLAMMLVASAAVLSCLVGWRLTRRLRQTLSAVMAALRSIRKGDFKVTLQTDQPDELGELQRTIVQMADTLRMARHNLEQKVHQRTQELQLAIEQIQQSDAEKRRLISHSNALIEEDRKRVAVEIHDHLGASLISVRLEASALAAKAAASGDDDMARSAKRIADTVQSLYVSSRNIVKSLRPEVIDTLGLAGAVEEMVRGFDQVHPDCRFSFSAPEQMPQLRGEFAMQAYRVIQESLSNVIKHAKASHASVKLDMGGQKDGQKDLLSIEIKDDGVGFNTGISAQTGLGLIGMRERVAAVGGEICISSPQGQGTTILVTLPLSKAL
jgi:two-component system sensor histidine kinase UhpB